jgi:hypothetical protein
LLIDHQDTSSMGRHLIYGSESTLHLWRAGQHHPPKMTRNAAEQCDIAPQPEVSEAAGPLARAETGTRHQWRRSLPGSKQHSSRLIAILRRVITYSA